MASGSKVPGVQDAPSYRLPAIGALLGTALCLTAVRTYAQQTNEGVGVTQSQQAVQPKLPVLAPPAPSHLLGDWSGVRTYLGDLGIDLLLDYTVETAWTVSGGRRRGATTNRA